MRTICSLTLLLLALCLPAGALGGTFAVPFGGGTPMLAAGWTPKADAGAVCGYEGSGTVFLNAGTLPAHSGCLYLFNAPAYAQIQSLNVSLSYAKASAATGLCAYSFGALPGDTMRRCSGGAFGNAIAASGASWVELGLYNESGSPIALATARANNVVFTGGWVTIADPTAPELAANGPSGIQTGLSATLNWAATDRESGSPSVAYSIDGGAPIGIRGQACSWLCGTAVGGSVQVDLGALADGPHSITVSSHSYADAGTSVGPLPFTVDRTAPRAAGIQVEPDAAAPASGWWGHGPVALTISSPTAADVVSSSVHLYAPSGELLYQASFAGAAAQAALPASAFGAPGAYEVDVVQCDAAAHCTVSPRAGLHWDSVEPATGADGFAPPLGAIAARDGAHLAWPAATGAGGASGIAGGFTGVGATPALARARALASTTWAPGAPGTSEAALSPELVHGADQVCVAVRLLSGAGIAASSAAVRCAGVDELPPGVVLGPVRAWSGGAQSVALAATDASGAGFSQVLVDGAAAETIAGAVTIAGEGAHVLRVVARDGAGNETVAERALGIDATPPSIGRVTADFLSRELRVEVADGLSGVARVELRLAGAVLETRLASDGRTAVARVPNGVELDGAAVVVRALDASAPANEAGLATLLPVRPLPAVTGLSVSGGTVTGRVAAPSGARIQLWAYPKGRAPLLVGSYATRSDGTFAVRVDPPRTTRYAIAVAESQLLRGLPERIAGSLRVTARITALRLRVRGDRLLVSARFGGRGETTRLHLLVHDVRGGRWVEGCLEHGRPGVRLAPSGRVSGVCRIPPSARGRAWTYRLVLAAPSSTWPWRTPSSAASSILLPL